MFEGLERLALHALAVNMIGVEHKRLGRKMLVQNGCRNASACLCREFLRQVGAARRWNLLSDIDAFGTFKYLPQKTKPNRNILVGCIVMVQKDMMALSTGAHNDEVPFMPFLVTLPDPGSL